MTTMVQLLGSVVGGLLAGAAIYYLVDAVRNHT